MKSTLMLASLSSLLLVYSCKKEQDQHAAETQSSVHTTEQWTEIDRIAHKLSATTDTSAVKKAIADGKLTQSVLKDISANMSSQPYPLGELTGDESYVMGTESDYVTDAVWNLDGSFAAFKSKKFPSAYNIAYTYDKTTLNGIVNNTLLELEGYDPYAQYNYVHSIGVVANARASAFGSLHEVLWDYWNRNYTVRWTTEPIEGRLVKVSVAIEVKN